MTPRVRRGGRRVVDTPGPRRLSGPFWGWVLPEREQTCGQFTEANPLGWRPYPTHPLTSRREPRSRRGVGCTRHPCRQASLRVSLRRGAGRPHPPAMGALSVIQWCAAPGPVACRRLGPVCQPCASPLRSRAVTGRAGPAPALWPHGRAAKAIRAVFGCWWTRHPSTIYRRIIE